MAAAQPDAGAMWAMMIEGSDDLADELGVPAAAPPPQLVAAIDAWLGAREGPLDESDVTRLGLLLARVLVDAHGGGLFRVDAAGHPLAGEWAVGDFRADLDPRYVVPIFVSAARIGVDRSLTAGAWYAQLRREGR